MRPAAESRSLTDRVGERVRRFRALPGDRQAQIANTAAVVGVILLTVVALVILLRVLGGGESAAETTPSARPSESVAPADPDDPQLALATGEMIGRALTTSADEVEPWLRLNTTDAGQTRVLETVDEWQTEMLSGLSASTPAEANLTIEVAAHRVVAEVYRGPEELRRLLVLVRVTGIPAGADDSAAETVDLMLNATVAIGDGDPILDRLGDASIMEGGLDALPGTFYPVQEGTT